MADELGLIFVDKRRLKVYLSIDTCNQDRPECG